MTVEQLFMQRYDVLYSVWLGEIWKVVPEELMRTRPHPKLNSIAWNLWHIARVEDAGLNSFVADRPQVLDEEWIQRLNVPWRHHGYGMTLAEVDELNEKIDLGALHDYSNAVEHRTREIIAGMDPDRLSETMQRERLQTILVDEGLAHEQTEGLLDNYLGWTKGKCMMNFGLTHSFYHVGSMGVLAKLLDVEF